MNKDDLYPIIAGSLRTVAQAVPGVGGVVAQAWSEYEGHQRNKRVDEFFQTLTTRLEAAKADWDSLKENISKMEDFPRLLEDTVAAVQRETEDAKRRLYPQFLLSLVSNESTVSPDQRRYLLETLDTLTLSDLEILKAFKQAGWTNGAILTQTSAGQFSSPSQKQQLTEHYSRLLGPTMISTAKLEARGLVVVVPNEEGFASVGVGWVDAYRMRTWQLLPIGRKLLKTLSA